TSNLGVGSSNLSERATSVRVLSSALLLTFAPLQKLPEQGFSVLGLFEWARVTRATARQESFELFSRFRGRDRATLKPFLGGTESCPTRQRGVEADFLPLGVEWRPL